MTVPKLLVALATAAILVVAAVLLAPLLMGPSLPPLPTGEQTMQRQDLAPTLRRRIEQALEAEGKATSSQTLITIGPDDCPSQCNAGMERGLCYCLRDEAQSCPAGWPLERGDPRSSCASLPRQAVVQADGAEDDPLVIEF